MAGPARRECIAIMAADIVGYSALMEDAEEAVHARAQLLHEVVILPAIDSYRGRLVKNTGDGFIASFSAAIEAMECALQIQDDLARAAGEPGAPPILFRIGINCADVIVETNDVFGDGVNLAARLQAMAEPGGIVLSGGAADDIRRVSDPILADLGTVSLKNFRRVVRAYAVASRAPVRLWHTLPRVFDDDRPVIIVLPFWMVPEDPANAWFAEGIIEGVIHVLSGIQNLSVIARGTSLAYVGAHPEPKRLAEELGVRYVLSGTVRRAGNRLRIIIELVDAETGHLLRSERLDGETTDLFAMQDEIATQVVATLAPTVQKQELARALRKHPDNLTAYDLMLRALGLVYGLKREMFDKARGLLQHAIAQDPGFSPAYSHAATWHNFRIGQGWSANIKEDAVEAGRLALSAIELDPNDATGLAIHGQVLSFTRRDYEGAQYFLARARQLGPSCHMAWTLSSATSNWTGQGAQSVEQAMHALRLSPMDPFAFFAEHMVSQGYYVDGEFEQAIVWGRRSARRNGLLTSNLRTLAAALVAQGELGAARSIAERIMTLEPSFSLSGFAARSPMQPSVLAHYLPRLRAAGLPD